MQLNMVRAKEEAELVMCGAVEGLLKKTGIRADQIDVLVTACSVFNTMPSLAAMVMNKFKMKPTTECYHLGGMGCAAGVSAPALAAKLLRARRRSGGYAVVVVHENITTNLYTGKDRSYLLTNVIFRMGGAAMLLTAEEKERHRAKYVLEHVVRSVTAADDEAMTYADLSLDKEGIQGVYMPPLKSLIGIASRAVKLTMRRLGEWWCAAS